MKFLAIFSIMFFSYACGVKTNKLLYSGDAVQGCSTNTALVGTWYNKYTTSATIVFYSACNFKIPGCGTVGNILDTYASSSGTGQIYLIDEDESTAVPEGCMPPKGGSTPYTCTYSINTDANPDEFKFDCGGGYSYTFLRS